MQSIGYAIAALTLASTLAGCRSIDHVAPMHFYRLIDLTAAPSPQR
jgi:hypothetical protein